MTKGLELHELPDWPAAMNQQTAAAYCGISVDTFIAHCPVQPIVITKSKAGKRYLRIRLDEWLWSIDTSASPKARGIGAHRLAARAARKAAET